MKMKNKKIFYINESVDLIGFRKSSGRPSNDAHMFLTDISNYICPRYHNSIYGFSSLKLIGCDSHIAQAKKLILSLLNRTHVSSDRYIEEAVRQVASSMIQNRGYAYYTFNLEDKLSLRNVRGRVVLDACNIMIVILPRTFGLDSNKKIINIKTENVFKFSMSSKCNEGNNISKLIASLMLSRDFPYENLNIKSGNFLIYSNVKNKRILSITKSWGWDMRGLSKDKLTVTYALYRKLNFIISLIKLRRIVIENLNKLFESAGLNVDVDIQEKFELVYLEDLKLKVRSGEILDSELKKLVGPI